MKKILSIATLFLIIISNAMAVEEANYEIIKTNEIYEIRKYGDRLAVQTIQNFGENCLSPVKLCHNLIDRGDQNYGSKTVFGRRYFEATARG